MNGTRFQQSSFSVISGEWERARATCAAVGHMDPDVRGKCFRCGEKVEKKAVPSLDDSKVLEYSKLRAAGVPVSEAAKAVFGPTSPLADDAIAPLELSQEPV